MNGFLFTKDGKLICELTEISFEPYKDKRIIKVRCTVCGRIKRIQNGSLILRKVRQNTNGLSATVMAITRRSM